MSETFTILEDDALTIGATGSRPCLFWAMTDNPPAGSASPCDGMREQVQSLAGWTRGEDVYLSSVRPQAPRLDDSELLDMGVRVCWTDSKYGAGEAPTFTPLQEEMRQHADLTDVHALTIVAVARNVVCPL
ncbi:hypothetical protein [Nocardia farcinica]|uniref:hypothetical protein n=1 Tax=Nocardia farcinica TaxID=37329 RepID=UPI000C019D71|nr:hypothetical protein [Nocardia farcinica]PFX05997.1 hypothetical protein CJ468_04994 [Nocardia farcinica]